MALVTVVIDLKIGPFTPSEPTYVRWTPYERFIEGSTVVLDVGAPVRLIGGEGVVTLPAGLWVVDELALNYVRTRVVRVPDSAAPVRYVDLDEVRDPESYGVGPTWALRAELAGKAAEYARRLAEAAETNVRELLDTAEQRFQTVLVYQDGAYPARPPVPGGLVLYIGPVVPEFWLTGDTWKDNS